MSADEFLQLYDQLADALFRHCYYRVFDRERAKDLVQETYLRAWEYMQRGQKILNMKAFLYRVANNLLIDESRKKRALSLDQLQAEGFEPAGPGAEVTETKLDADAVLRIVKDLNPDYREVFVMRYVNGLEPREIAEILGESPNVISVRLHRAIRQLKQTLAYGI
ncbi:MAG: RNA polymerase sigma factor [Candidatus Kerfeldbacteria bacterium]|nr:RNA polymerase sigma factor [Candidatus Kerfeldbacteria bacterium]